MDGARTPRAARGAADARPGGWCGAGPAADAAGDDGGQHRGIGHGASIHAGRIPEPWWAWNDALVRHTATFGNDGGLLRAFRGGGLSYAPQLQITLDELARIEVPTLAVWGADDTDVDATTGRAMAEAMPNGRIEVLPGAGHLPWIDYPDQVADLVRTHLTST